MTRSVPDLYGERRRHQSLIHKGNKGRGEEDFRVSKKCFRTVGAWVRPHAPLVPDPVHRPFDAMKLPPGDGARLPAVKAGMLPPSDGARIPAVKAGMMKA